jgi:transposase
MDINGKILRQKTFPSTPVELEAYARKLGKDDEVALEATTNCFAFSKVLKKYAGKVLISNPMQTKAIAWARIKTDKVDAQVLAHLLRTGFLPEVWEPDEETQKLRRRTAHRESLGQMRAKVKNRIHSILHRNLVDPGEMSDLFGKKGLEALGELCVDKEILPEDDRWQLSEELKMLAMVETQIEEAHANLAKETVDNPVVRLLMTLPGINYYSASGIASAIGSIERFPESKKLASYFGLNPQVIQSGDHCWTGRISKRGRSNARWLLVEASQIAVRSPGPLQSFFQRILKKKCRNIAIVAVARKLSDIIWHMLKNNEPYRWAPPLRTKVKIRSLEIIAGKPKLKGGNPKGQPLKKAGEGRRAKLKLDYDLAKVAQAQYEMMVKSWRQWNSRLTSVERAAENLHTEKVAV